MHHTFNESTLSFDVIDIRSHDKLRIIHITYPILFLIHSVFHYSSPASITRMVVYGTIYNATIMVNINVFDTEGAVHIRTYLPLCGFQQSIRSVNVSLSVATRLRVYNLSLSKIANRFHSSEVTS